MDYSTGDTAETIYRIQETKNAIASKLRHEYTDYIESLDMIMSDALADNYKAQIATIFKILQQQGIKFD